MPAHYLTVSQAAENLNLSAVHVRDLCARGVIRAEKAGRDWLIAQTELARYRRRILRAAPKRGRPPKILRENA